MKSIQSSTEVDKKAMQDTIDVSSSLSTTEASKLPPISPDLLKTVRSITSKLPIYSFCLLQLLSRHLKRVSDNEKENRMSVSNLALIFIPTLNIGRALFHCMVEHYCEIFEGNTAGPVYGKGTTIVPPPLPQKPRNFSREPTRKIFHAKTVSDTELMKPSSINLSPVTKVPPPKPSRSPLPSNNSSTTTFQPHHQRQQSENQQYTGSSNPILPRPRVPVKPRSKSLSSPMHRSHIPTNSNENGHSEDILMKRSGRVEAIGRQFETLMNNKNACSK